MKSTYLFWILKSRNGSKEELSDILHQQIAAGQETEQIRKEGEAIRQEVS